MDDELKRKLGEALAHSYTDQIREHLNAIEKITSQMFSDAAEVVLLVRDARVNRVGMVINSIEQLDLKTLIEALQKTQELIDAGVPTVSQIVSKDPAQKKEDLN